MIGIVGAKILLAQEVEHRLSLLSQWAFWTPEADGYLDTVNQVSGTIGTALSRFQIAAHVASSVADVSQAAEARITDADTAENSAALLRSKILQQASAAVLAQANQQPALALTLLHE